MTIYTIESKRDKGDLAPYIGTFMLLNKDSFSCCEMLNLELDGQVGAFFRGIVESGFHVFF